MSIAGCAAPAFTSAFSLASLNDGRNYTADTFAPYTNSQGADVLKSFDPATYPGESNPLGSLVNSVGLAGAGLLGGKLLSSLDSVGTDTRSFYNKIEDLLGNGTDSSKVAAGRSALSAPSAGEGEGGVGAEEVTSEFALGQNLEDGSFLESTPEAEGPISSTGTKPAWLQRLAAGNDFNKVQAGNYPYNEVYVERPDGNGYYRLDSYSPEDGEIVSRKFTQLSEINEYTAQSYINEAVKKYPSGATIAYIPSSGALAGQKLQGAVILEVPPQANGVPQSILDFASKAGVVIKDVNGKVY